MSHIGANEGGTAMKQLRSELRLQLEVAGNRVLTAVLGPIPQHLALNDALSLLEWQLRERRQQLTKRRVGEAQPEVGIIHQERRSPSDRRQIPERRRPSWDRIRGFARSPD